MTPFGTKPTIRTKRLSQGRLLNSFDAEITKQSRRGFEYNPLTFREQWHFLKSMFYKVPQGTQLQIKRRYEGGAPDDFIPAAEVHNTLLRLFGDELHPCIQEWAIHYIPTTAGARYNPATDDPFFVVEGTQFRNAYTPSRYAAYESSTTVRPAKWQAYTWIGLCPVTKPAPQRRVKHCSSRYSSRHS